MAEYIRRDDAVKIAERYELANGSVLGRHTGLADCIASEISGLPAAEVAEVVRCKDCRYLGKALDKGLYSCDDYNLPYCEPDSFCSHGETEGGSTMRIITRTLRLKHRDERFLMCNACNTSFVANLREAARVHADDTFEDGTAYDYTFHCPVCGVNVYLPNERTAV